MFEHLSAVLQDEEMGHGNMGQLVQAHIPSMQKEFQTFFPDLNALDSNFIRSVWRCDLYQMACRRTLTKFLSKMSESYPCVADVLVKALLMFPSTAVPISANKDSRRCST